MSNHTVGNGFTEMRRRNLAASAECGDHRSVLRLFLLFPGQQNLHKATG